jgi:hypothetical protein
VSQKADAIVSPASRKRFEGTLMSGPQDLTASFRSVRCGTPQHIVQARTFLANAEPFKDTKTVRRRQWWGSVLANQAWVRRIHRCLGDKNLVSGHDFSRATNVQEGVGLYPVRFVYWNLEPNLWWQGLKP